MENSTTSLDPSLTDDSSYIATRVSSDVTDTWPPAPTVVAHTLGGALADRVRRRFTCDEGAEVKLVETTTFGGYSEWTRENSTEFTVTCDSRTVTFHPRGGEVDWRDEAGKSWADSVFARFDAWLAVAERPSALFAEWFELEDEASQIVRYQARPDTILTRAAQEHDYAVRSLSLTGVGDSYGRTWTLDFIAAPDDTGFQKILRRFTLCYAEGLTISDRVAREVLTVLTDDIFPGRER